MVPNHAHARSQQPPFMTHLPPRPVWREQKSQKQKVLNSYQQTYPLEKQTIVPAHSNKSDIFFAQFQPGF